MNLSRFWVANTIGDRLKELRRAKGEEQKQFLSQEKVANDLNLSRSVIGRFENDQQPLSADDIIMFSEYYDISCYSILYGIKHECFEIHRVTGLEQSSIDWLSEINKNNPEILSMVNYVLSNNDNIANLLFEIFHIYAELWIPSIAQADDGTFIGKVSLALSDEETLLKKVMSDYIFSILMLIRNKFDDTKRLDQRDEKVRGMLENIREESKRIREESERIKSEKDFEDRD